jgi:hypothetical protein
MLKRIELIKHSYQQVIFVVLAFLAMVLVSYFYVSNIVNRQMRLFYESILNTAQTAVSASLLERELSFSSISVAFENLISSGKNNDEMLQYLIDINSFYL